MGNTVDQIVFFGFALAVLLIVVVYFVGVSTDATSLGKVINSLMLTSTGRTQNGQFAQYPNNPS